MSRLLSLFAVLLGVAYGCAAADCVVPAGSVLRILLAPGTAISPKPAAILTGSLDRSVYSGTCQAIPQGASVSAVVGRVTKQRAKPVVLRWIKQLAGAARIEPSVTLRSVEMRLPEGGSVPLHANFLRMERQRHRAASAKRPASSRPRHMLLLEVVEPVTLAATVPPPLQPASAMVSVGTIVRVDLVTALTSATSREGDIVLARLAEPVLAGGQVILPEGTVFEGVVAQSKRAARPYRSGRMRLSFRSLRLPGGQSIEAVTAPTAGEFANATKMDAEGGFTGGALNRKQAVLNAGVAYLTGKILDDLVEEGAKAALGAAVAGSAETAARYVGLAAGGFIFLMHRGRDVSLNSHTELQLTFTRGTRIQP